ncbi:MAG: hypothetical protein AB7N91_00630 [Candidatus Tectimicrobiota bacterium]
MQPITDVQALLRARRAVRAFSPAAVPDALVYQVLTAAIHTPLDRTRSPGTLSCP